ncbi:ABC transporter permease [Acidaminobacterium chupaoyuni]
MRKKHSPIAVIYSALIFLFLYAPIVVLIVYSFNANKSRGSWGGFSLKWYQSLFENSQIMSSLGTTLTIALISSMVAMVIGTMAALGMYASRKRTRNLLNNIASLPMSNPDIVTGVSLMILFIFLGIRLGYISLLLSHIAFDVPYVIVSVLPKLNQMDKNTFEAAQDLGATPIQAFFKVILPEILPGIFTGTMLAFTMSLDDFVVSFFTAGNGVSTLSMTVYSMTRKGVKPEINAISAIMFVTVLILLVIINVRSSKDARQKEKQNY